MKLTALLCSLFISLSLFAQKIQVQNSYMYMREKKWDKAKAAADASTVHEKTKSDPEAWLHSGMVYQGIYSDTSRKVNDLDLEAEEKSVQGFVKCLELDKSGVHKNEVKSKLVGAVGALNGKVDKYYIPAKMYDQAVKGCEILLSALPYDFESTFKQKNVTPENLNNMLFKTYLGSNNLVKAKELGDKLIASNFKMPSIYTSMTKLALHNKDTAGAMTYLDKGLALFDDNVDLMVLQIDILLKQNKNDVAKKKLIEATELSPDNDQMHAVLANLYERFGEIENAEKSYMKAVEINPKNLDAQYNLGNMNFNKGIEYSKKLDELPPKETAKAKDYEAKADAYFKKCLTPFEAYYKIKQDPAVKQRLRQAYARLGNAEKAAEYK